MSARESRAEQRMRDYAEDHELTVDVPQLDPYTVTVEAPKGHHFDGGVHERVIEGNPEDAPRDVWSRALREIKADVIEACCEGCEWWEA